MNKRREWTVELIDGRVNAPYTGGAGTGNFYETVKIVELKPGERVISRDEFKRAVANNKVSDSDYYCGGMLWPDVLEFEIFGDEK